MCVSCCIPEQWAGWVVSTVTRWWVALVAELFLVTIYFRWRDIPQSSTTSVQSAFESGVRVVEVVDTHGGP
jgi:hypothetical protein